MIVYAMIELSSRRRALQIVAAVYAYDGSVRMVKGKNRYFQGTAPFSK